MNQQVMSPQISSAQLAYEFVLGQNGQQGITYIDAAGSATLQVIIDNPGAALQLDSITFLFTCGNDASDLAATPGDVNVVMPDTTWTDNGNFSYSPPSGYVIGTGSITFTFTFTANSAIGAATVGVREVSARGTGFLATPFAVVKMPAAFVLQGLTATPSRIPLGGTVTLQWTGTPGQAYSVSYSGGTVPVSSTSPLFTWTSPQIITSQPQLTFEVSGSAQTAGGTTVSAQVSATVFVTVPSVSSFTGPDAPSFSNPVMLQWNCTSDSCELHANGVLLGTGLPASTPAAGYAVTLNAPLTTFELYAVTGTAKSLPASLVLAFYQWTAVATLPLSTGASMVGALSPDGSTLYVIGSTGCATIDTTHNTITSTGAGIAPGAGLAAITPDGSEVFVSGGGSMFTYPTSSFGSGSAAFGTGAVQGFALSPDGSTVHVVTMTALLAYTAAGTLVNTISLPQFGIMGWAAATPDGSAVYVAQVTPLDGGTVMLCRYDTTTGSVTALTTSSLAPVPPCISADGSTMFAADLNGNLVTLALPGGTAGSSCAVAAGSVLGSLVADATGAGVYGSITAADGMWTVCFANPQSGASHHITTGSYACVLAVSHDGTRVYVSSAGSLIVFATDSWD